MQATNEHWTENNGTVFLVSSDIFTFSGLLNSADGVPALRSWAITNTNLIAEVDACLCFLWQLYSYFFIACILHALVSKCVVSVPACADQPLWLA